MLYRQNANVAVYSYDARSTDPKQVDQNLAGHLMEIWAVRACSQLHVSDPEQFLNFFLNSAELLILYYKLISL